LADALRDGPAMKTLGLLLLALAACMDSGSSGGPGNVLDADAHFVGLVGTHATPEDCLAKEPNPFVCEYSLSLCANGRAGLRRGDLVSEGTYTLNGVVANATFTDNTRMSFDVQAAHEIGSPQKWIVDRQERWNTLAFDNIDCGSP
jgi:hypothetical protein